MANNFKIKYNKLSDIEIYDLILQGRVLKFPSGFWVDRNVEEAKEVAIQLLKYLIEEKLKMNREDIKRKLSKKFITKYKLHTASKLFGRSAIKYLMSCYPQKYEAWQFTNDKVPQSYWVDEENRINAVKYLIEIELKWSIQELKEKLSWIVLKENGLMTLHSYYTGLFELVNGVYPNENISPWELENGEVPNGTWENKNNRINAVKWLVKKLDYKCEKLDRITFGKYGLSKLLTEYFGDNIQKSIIEAFPNGEYSVKKNIDYPYNWINLYNKYKNRELSAKKAMDVLGLKRSTFYRIIKKYENGK